MISQKCKGCQYKPLTLSVARVFKHGYTPTLNNLDKKNVVGYHITGD